MADPVEDKALAAAGATTETSNSGAIDDKGAPTPPAETNTPPVVEPTAEEAAAAKVVSDAAEAAAAQALVDAAEKENAPLDTELWGTTGDKAGDATMTLMQNAGMTPEEAKALVFDAITAGDINKIDIAALTEKVGADKATLIMAGGENYLAKRAAQTTAAQAVVAEMHTVVGGEDNWKAITAWAKTDMDATLLDQYRPMLDAGGAQAKFAATELKAAYNAADGNTTISTAETAEVTGDGPAPSSARAITKQEAYAEQSALNRQGKLTPQAEADIRAARNRGRAKGI